MSGSGDHSLHYTLGVPRMSLRNSARKSVFLYFPMKEISSSTCVHRQPSFPFVRKCTFPRQFLSKGLFLHELNLKLLLYSSLKGLLSGPFHTVKTKTLHRDLLTEGRRDQYSRDEKRSPRRRRVEMTLTRKFQDTSREGNQEPKQERAVQK